MKKTMLWFIISIVVIGVVAYILSVTDSGTSTNSGSSQTNTNTSTNTSNATSNTNGPSSVNAEPQPQAYENRLVSVTSSGFVPDSLTIESGGTVVWKNDSNATIYVAPDDHPSHSKYTGVWDDDGSGRIEPGEQYSFTFDTSGTYDYHDHVNASRTGTIIVQ